MTDDLHGPRSAVELINRAWLEGRPRELHTLPRVGCLCGERCSIFTMRRFEGRPPVEASLGQRTGWGLAHRASPRQVSPGTT